MNLNYKVLWIDDDEDWLDSFADDRVLSHIRTAGFKPEIIKVYDISTIDEHDFSEYDLAIIDYHISEDETGDDVIKRVRDRECHTEFLFYSGGKALSELRGMVAQKELEGVYCSSRQSDSLNSKICSVFDITTRNIVDMENMRGIIMSGIAEIDKLLCIIILGIYERYKDTEQACEDIKLMNSYLAQKIVPKKTWLKPIFIDEDYEKIKGELDEVFKKIKLLQARNIDEILQSYMFDSNKKNESALSLVQKCQPMMTVKIDPQRLNNIKISLSQLLAWRNALAHQNPVDEDGIKKFKILSEYQEFNPKKARELRVSINTIISELLNLSECIRS
ncbi:hypothetical protein [Aeromonas hydrophila]|uniref:hypothetical protein n=1 Tax=Aeromonas TaxID=642 RepID=UPI0030187FA3